MWHTFNAMNEVMRPGEEGLWGLFSSAQRIAWKTGTSFWFQGWLGHRFYAKILCDRLGW
jgi:penicillin-binding protein 1C